MPIYFYRYHHRYLPYHYYTSWILGEYVIDDFGTSVEIPFKQVWGIE